MSPKQALPFQLKLTNNDSRMETINVWNDCNPSIIGKSAGRLETKQLEMTVHAIDILCMPGWEPANMADGVPAGL